MTIDYELTKDDFRAFNLHHVRHSPTTRRQYLRAWLSFPVMWLIICTALWYLADRERGTPMKTFIALLPLYSGAPLYLIYYPWAYRRTLRKTVDGMMSEGRNGGTARKYRVSISPENVTESTDHVQTSTAWRGVEKITTSTLHAYIYTNALAAIIVPRRAFADPSEFEAFVHTAQAYYENAAR